MKILTIIGNRPQFVKLAAVSPLLRERHEEILVHTGQHYDRELSEIFFEQLALPEPDVDLGIAGGSNTRQTSRMLAAIEPLLAEHSPDAVVVYGDTNSTLAGALAAAQAGVPLAHVEAGLRSFDRAMPEEVNRVVCDALSGLLLAPSGAAVENLAREGVIGEVVATGDVMGDVVLRAREIVDAAAVCELYAVSPGEFLLMTAHRAANVDDPGALTRLVELIESLPATVVLPLHPRTQDRLERFKLIHRLAAAEHVRLLPPVGYLETIALTSVARAVLTDSGGLQKEAVWLGTQCLTLRPSTEWIETLDGGWNTLVELDAERVAAALAAGRPAGEPPALYGAGTAGAAVVEALENSVAITRRSGVESAS
ncbi:MAG: UDP-N-acetylglucosamine 2-epimerase (non-hydrolyzing) [Actinobacteria bacterium]|nr:UDP-N-acetylglucosamine 2-epimerase (non-hydrolyzing) [Actinomycetota bacterium]